jgi:hypothetical protein
MIDKSLLNEYNVLEFYFLFILNVVTSFRLSFKFCLRYGRIYIERNEINEKVFTYIVMFFASRLF